MQPVKACGRHNVFMNGIKQVNCHSQSVEKYSEVRDLVKKFSIYHFGKKNYLFLVTFPSQAIQTK